MWHGEMILFQRLGECCPNAYHCVWSFSLQSIYALRSLCCSQRGAGVRSTLTSPWRPLLFPGLGFQQAWHSPQLCLLHFLSASSQGAVWEVFRIWELRRYFTRIKFTVKARTKGLKRLVVACQEADGHVNSGGPTKWQRRWVIISLPLPCHPRPVISGQNSQQRKQSLTPRLGSHFRCKMPGGWSDGGCHMLKCLLSWMRNSTQRKVSPLQRSSSDQSELGVSYTGQQPNSLLLAGYGMDKGVEQPAGAGKCRTRCCSFCWIEKQH